MERLLLFLSSICDDDKEGGVAVMSKNTNINIAGLGFSWDVEQGKFLYENQDAVLFWINSAMKSFFDTIEEVSGEEVSNLVFETTGYRQGVVVGDYLRKIKDFDVLEAANMITNTYASAGWGRAEIKNLDYDTKTLVAHLRDSWEYKINLTQGKNKGTAFLAAHFAGVFSRLLGVNVWYEYEQAQLEGHEYSIVKYFPSDITATSNIHQLARKKESEQILRLEEMVEKKTGELRDLVKKLSSPIIPVFDGIVVVPLIGKYEEDRSEDLFINTLSNLPKHKANYLILDLTGLDKEVDHFTIDLIVKIGSAASLIGTKSILVGIPPNLAVEMVQSNITLSRYQVFQTLQHGIQYALAQMGKTIN
jgi:rsbT co-antagonist protein RsbR